MCGPSSDLSIDLLTSSVYAVVVCLTLIKLSTK